MNRSGSILHTGAESKKSVANIRCDHVTKLEKKSTQHAPCYAVISHFQHLKRNCSHLSTSFKHPEYAAKVFFLQSITWSQRSIVKIRCSDPAKTAKNPCHFEILKSRRRDVTKPPVKKKKYCRINQSLANNALANIDCLSLAHESRTLHNQRPRERDGDRDCRLANYNNDNYNNIESPKRNDAR